jgi:6-phosphogluconolactonase
MTPPVSPEVLVLEDASAVATTVAARIAAAAVQASRSHRRFSLALAGGETPRATYAALGRRDDVNWTLVDLFFGDERAVPPDHPESNYAMVQSSLLVHPGPARARVYRMPADAADLDEAALEYESTLCRVLGTPPRLDVVLLGLGEDGHTASLFPGQPALAESERYVVATPAPHIAPRLTVTFAALAQARAIFFVVTGAAKAPILARALAGDGDAALPAQRVALRDGRVTWFVDRAARGAAS